MEINEDGRKRQVHGYGTPGRCRAQEKISWNDQIQTCESQRCVLDMEELISNNLCKSNYIYSPKEARVQKALRQVAHYLKVGKAIRSHKATTAVPAKRARSRHNPVSSRREEQMQILDMFPMSVAKFVGPVSVTTSAPATTIATQKARKSATSSHKSSKNSSASTQLTALEITSPLSDNSGVVSGAENTHSPLPAFKQAFGSTEIGCYSHEGFFNTTQQAENQQSISNEKPDPLEFKLPPYEFYVEGLLPEWEFMNEIIKFDSVACLDDRF